MKKFEKAHSGIIVRYCPDIYQDELRKTTKNVMIVCVYGEMRNGHLPNARLKPRRMLNFLGQVNFLYMSLNVKCV